MRNAIEIEIIIRIAENTLLDIFNHVDTTRVAVELQKMDKIKIG